MALIADRSTHPVPGSAPAARKLSLSFLTRLGVPWLWGADVEKGWVFMRFNVVPLTTRWLAPGSYSYGLERLPKRGGAVVAINHLSAIDPPLVGSFSHRAIFYMAKHEILQIPVVGEALTWTGGFPVRRGNSDREGLRTARELVREGHVIGVFAEGTRQRFGYPGAVHTGAALIAMKEHVPLIPVGVETFGWSRTNRRACAVVWGEPMSFSGISRNGRGYKEASELMRLEILRLWRQAAEAVTMGFPDALEDGTPRCSWPRAREFNRQRTPRRVSGIA
jgi:1-acyl-sn-glycerol-3-phosphate acyltransferase